MKTFAIAAALLIAVLLAAPSPATAGGYYRFRWGAPVYGYGCGRPSYWGAPMWAGAYRPYVYPGYYYYPQPYYGGGGYWGDAYYRGAPVDGPYRSYRSYRYFERGPYLGSGVRSYESGVRDHGGGVRDYRSPVRGYGSGVRSYGTGVRSFGTGSGAYAPR
jgi:hypothetical protein